MYCRNCGQELNENDRICPVCGAPVNKDAAADEKQNEGSHGAAAQGAPRTGKHMSIMLTRAETGRLIATQDRTTSLLTTAA